jgi:diguanylate cyclase (GGDEF)-like protein
MLILSFNLAPRLHRLFFGCGLTLCIWAFSFSISNSAPDLATALFWRRVAALGWGTFYSFFLHFILALTERDDWLKKKWVYFVIYTPALLNIFVFSLLGGIAPAQYDLIKIYSGWINVSQPTLWDRLYQVYYVSYSAIGMGIIWQWGKSSRDQIKKIQATLMFASYATALILGTLTEFVINLYFPFKIPQLGPVIVLIPVAVMFYCIQKYGWMAPRVMEQEADGIQILSEINRKQLYLYLSWAYVLAAFLIFATLYFFNQQPLQPVLLFSAIILAFGLILQIIQNLNIKTIHKDVVSCAIMTISIPLAEAKYAGVTGFYALFAPMILVIISVAFNHRWELLSVGTATLLTLVWMEFEFPLVTMTVKPLDHSIRIISFGGFLLIAFYINHLYIQRLTEKEEQVKVQKLLSQISNLFITANENNIGAKNKKIMDMLGTYFGADRISLFFFFNGQTSKEYAYEWCNAGVESILDHISEANIADLPKWMEHHHQSLKEGCFYIPDVAALPDTDPDKVWFQDRGSKSLLVIPLINIEKVVGFLIFDTIKNVKIWSVENQGLLQMVANRIKDVWLKVQAEKEVNYLAYYDVLTGLPNRTLLNERLERAISMATRTEKLMMVAFIDIDNLKSINDTMGHDGGDDLLRQVSKRLSACVRPYDTMARFGADEFIAIIPQVALPDDVKKVADKFIDIFREPLVIKNQEFFVTASAGVAVFPADGETPEELIKNADLAMYIAKEKGKNRYVLCSPELKSESLKIMELTNSLYRALERDELALYYQPKVITATGEISGVEALIRWNHPQKGMILPGEFIPLAEKNGLITPIGDWVLETACRQNKAWQDMGLKPITMAVNLSLKQFINKKLAGTVAEILQKTGLDPACLELEITESIAIHEPDDIIKTLNELKALGVSISIDDFGIEYSSLSRLKTLPVDKVKIDTQFVQGITQGSKEQGIIKVILQLARALDLKVTAEGVETEQQLSFLRKISCDEIQGYYYYKPMPLDIVEPILKNMLSCQNEVLYRSELP